MKADRLKGEELDTIEPPVVVTAPVLADYRIPASARVNAVKGLLRVELTRTAAAASVSSYWTSRAVAQERIAKFNEVFCTMATADAVAVVSDVRLERPWLPSTAAGWVERLAALVGALLIIGNFWGTLTAPPSIGFTAPERIDVLVGETASFEAAIVNRGDVDTRVTLASTSARVVIDPDTVRLEPRQRVAVRVTDVAGPLGTTTLPLSATATAGLLRASAVVSRDIVRRNWAAIMTETVTLLDGSARSARFRAVVGTGAAQSPGLRCLAVAGLPASARFVGVAPAETHDDAQYYPEPKNEVVSLVWLTQPTHAFQSMSPTLYLEANEDWDISRWAALASRTTVTCERR